LPDATTPEAYSGKSSKPEGISPKTASDFLRGGGYPDSTGFSGSVPNELSAGAFLALAEEYGLGDGSVVEGLRLVVSHSEHTVYFYSSDTEELAIKITHPGSFGHSPFELGARASPLDYLDRLYLQNEFFGDDIKIIAVEIIKDAVRLISSQPWIAHGLPCSADVIESYFREFGFEAFPIDDREIGYYHPTREIFLRDPHPSNVLRAGGRICPIDVVIGYPGPGILDAWKRFKRTLLR
jgi:hypothetical protein